MTGASYARGSLAYGICQRCGMRALLNSLMFDGRYAWLRVHPECWEDKHPQERMIAIHDPIALYRPSPEDNQLVAPILSVAQAGTDLTLAWTPARTEAARYEGYILFRSDNGADPVQLVGQAIEYDWDARKIFEPLSHLDDSTEPGHTYGYYVAAYDCYQRQLASNTVVQAVA